MRQTRAAPAASIHTTRYVTPPQPEKRCKLAGRTYGMPFVSLILRLLQSMTNLFFHNTSPSESQARAELNRARATVLRALQAADRTERRVTDTQIGHAIVGMV